MRKHRWLFTLLLLLVSSFALADSSTPSIASDAVSSHTDLSINYLSQIFGSVGGILSGTSGQMLGKLFYEFNVGILVVVGLWLSYTVVLMVVSSSMEGAFLNSRQGNTVMIILRIVFGIALLFPSPTTGYSAIQDIVMQVVVKGVALADMTWSHGLEYIQDGGSVWHPPSTASDGGGLNAAQAQTVFSSAIMPVFNGEVCMMKASAQASLQSMLNHSSGNTGIANSGVSSDVEYQVNQNNTAKRFEFPNSQTNSTGCGSVGWANISKNVPADKQTVQLEYAKDALYHAVYALLPAAKQYACSTNPAFQKAGVCFGISTDGMQDNVSEVMFNSLLGYVNSVSPVATTSEGKALNNLQGFFSQAGQQGWILAGRYVWDLSELKDRYKSSQDLSQYLPAPSGISAPSNPINWWSTAVSQKFNNYVSASDAGSTGSSTTANGVGAGAGAGAGMIAAGPVGAAVGAVVGSLIEDSVRLHDMFTASHMGHDPMYFLHEIGLTCMSLAGDIWISTAIVVGLLMFIGIFCSGGSLDLDRPIEEAVSWFKPLAMAIAGTFLSAGAVLAFYVPIYPFMIFTFGVIAWFIAVIESMAAAPLVAFGLTHPEGHDFLGPAKQGLMLLLGIFLRPALMVIGLIASMILSYVCLRMVNYAFASFIHDLFQNPAANIGDVAAGSGSFAAGVASDAPHSVGSLITYMLAGPLSLAMFTMIVYLVITQCYSLIYVLPDYVMRWIGGPTGQSTAQQMAQEARSLPSSAAGLGAKMGDGMVSAGSSSGHLGGKLQTSSGHTKHKDGDTPDGAA